MKFKTHYPIAAFFLSVAIASCGNPPKRVSVGGGSATSDGTPGTKTGAGTGTASVPGVQQSVVDKILLNSADCNGKSQIGKPQLRLLTKDEYQNTVKDILQIKVDYRSSLPVEIEVAGFKNNADAGILSDTHVAAYLNTAVSIADEIRPNLKNLVGCAESEKTSCAKKVVDQLTPLLWRRPLTELESKELTDLYAAVPSDLQAESMTLLLTRILTSSNFLYRSEIGKAGSLNAYELASALSYFFWGTSPDKTLIDLAKDGTLSTEAVLNAQATRLFNDARSSFLLTNFAEGWLAYKRVIGFGKDAAVFPAWNADLQKAMAAEAEETFAYFMRLPNAKYENLMTSDFSIGSATLAKFYGAESVKEEGINKIKFGNSPRRGLIGYGALLSTQASTDESHPFKRGHFVLEKLFCVKPEPTPDNAVFKIPEKDPKKSTRERFQEHSSNPSCIGCHLKLDNIGYGMEDFDGIGLYRTEDNGKAIDVAGTLFGIDSKTTPFKGTKELSTQLAESAQAKRCFALQWYRYGQGHVEREQDICAVRDIADQFASGSLTLGQLIMKTITHGSVQKRGQ